MGAIANSNLDGLAHMESGQALRKQMAVYALLFWVLVRVIQIRGRSAQGSHGHALDA